MTERIWLGFFLPEVGACLVRGRVHLECRLVPDELRRGFLQRDDHRVGALFIAARQRVGCWHGEVHNLPRARADRAAAAGFDLRRNLIEVRAVGERDLDDAVRVVNFSRLVSDFEGGNGKAVVDRLAVIIVSAAALAAGHDAVCSGSQARTLDRVLRAFREILRRGRGGKNFIRALAQRELRRHNAREVCRVGNTDEADRAGRAGRRNHRAVLHAVDLDRKCSLSPCTRCPP